MRLNHIASKRFEVTQKARKVVSLEAMVMDLERMALELFRQIAAEEQRIGVRDPNRARYSTLAKALTLRRSKLLNSVADLRVRLDMARREQQEAEAECVRLGFEPDGANRDLRKVDSATASLHPN
jgi:hypothetical protein